MIRILGLFTLVLLFASCKKGNPATTTNVEIKNVTGIAWQMVKVQKNSDAYINPIPMRWQLNLNTDGSFVYNLDGVVCNGAYTWAQLDSLKADVNFTIQTWNTPTSDNGISEKLKEIVQSVRSCELRKSPFTAPLPGYLNPPSLELLFQGAAGELKVVKW